MRVFWENGYAATSLDQIAKATRINRPSLNAAFGSKKELYLRTIENFADHMHSTLAKAASSHTTVSARLAAVFETAIDLYTTSASGTPAALGCFVMSTLPSEADTDPEMRESLLEVTNRMDSALAKAVRDTPSNGKETGQLLAILLHGLSLRARAGENPDRLKCLANAGLNRLLAQQPDDANLTTPT